MALERIIKEEDVVNYYKCTQDLKGIDVSSNIDDYKHDGIKTTAVHFTGSPENFEHLQFLNVKKLIITHTSFGKIIMTLFVDHEYLLNEIIGVHA